MVWAGVSYLLAGIFLVNAVPHAVSGVTGRSFQTPFARPPGKGVSSSLVNWLWGFANLAAAYYLLRVGSFDWRAAGSMVPFALGGLAMGLFAARYFGGLHGRDAGES